MNTIDYGVIAIYVAVMLGIGAYYAWQNKSAEDFILGGRRLSPIALGLSLFATLVSTLSYLANPGEMIAHGPMFITNLAAHPLIFVIVGFVLIPLLMKQPVTSAYELLESRLGLSIRLAGAGVFILLRMGWMATILFATSRNVLIPMLGIDSSWIVGLCIVLGIMTATYASIGGIKAVVLTDAIQAIMMLGGAIITLAVITYRLGGVSQWWPTQWPEHWQELNWGFDPNARMSFGILLLSTTLWYVCTNGSDQMSIQRFLSTRNPSAARKTLAISQCTEIVIALLLALTGVAVLGFYQANSPDLPEGKTIVSIADELFPRFIINEMSGGLAGLVLAAILSAALSSLSSGVNSVCAVLEKDFLSRGKTLEPKLEVLRLRIITWAVAIVAIGLSILNTLIEGNLLERCYKVTNLLTAPLFVLFFLALFVRWANTTGAWAGLICSAATAVLIAYSKEFGFEGAVSFVWMMPCSLAVGIVVGTVVSAVARR
jgi:solute:Na+ symporter, SSS family